MPRLTPKPIELEENEEKELEKIIARHSTPQQIAKRAKMIIFASVGKNHREIARLLGVSREMARLWRERWLKLKQQEEIVRERLLDAERPGAPTKFTTEQVLKLFAIASFATREIWKTDKSLDIKRISRRNELSRNSRKHLEKTPGKTTDRSHIKTPTDRVLAQSPPRCQV